MSPARSWVQSRVADILFWIGALAAICACTASYTTLRESQKETAVRVEAIQQRLARVEDKIDRLYMPLGASLKGED